MAHRSAPELLVLHAIRLKGMADVDKVATRFALDRGLVSGVLREHEANGWVEYVEFADLRGWTLTGPGRNEDNRLLAEELAEAGVRDEIAAGHADFLQLNGPFLSTVTNWQIRPGPGDPLAANDHTDIAWDEEVLDELVVLGARLRPVSEQLAGALDRFGGYSERFISALDRARRGAHGWVDQPGIDSCHMVWMELHEDLLATLGLERRQES